MRGSIHPIDIEKYSQPPLPRVGLNNQMHIKFPAKRNTKLSSEILSSEEKKLNTERDTGGPRRANPVMSVIRSVCQIPRHSSRNYNN